MLSAKGFAPLTLQDITPGPAQLKAMVDLCHVYGIAVAFDVVYNHAGGFTVNGQLDDNASTTGTAPKTSAITTTACISPIRTAEPADFPLLSGKMMSASSSSTTLCYYIDEFHVDGFRYDEISDLMSMNCDSGWSFCCEPHEYAAVREAAACCKMQNFGRAKSEIIQSPGNPS